MYPGKFAFIIIAIVIVGVVFFYLWRDFMRYRGALHGTPATAVVTAVGKSMQEGRYGGQIIVRLGLRVFLPDAEPYETSVVWAIGPASVPKVQEFKEIRVKIDPDNPKAVYPDVVWAQYHSGWMLPG